jgi:hypothetical protein
VREISWHLLGGQKPQNTSIRTVSCPVLEPGTSQIEVQNITISANLLGMFLFVGYFMMLLLPTLYSKFQDDKLQNGLFYGIVSRI